MSNHPKKAVVIGLDAPIIKSVEKYMKEKKLPNISRLVRNGVWAENCLVPHPTITPPNWTTIVTGAWPGTHCITCFTVHQPGTELDKEYAGFHADDCKAEYIWNAAAKAGKRSIVINYPTTWAERGCVKSGIQIGGAGLSINEWRTDKTGAWIVKCTLSADLLFATEEFPEATLVTLQPAVNWKNLSRHRKAFACELNIVARMPRDPVEPKIWHLAAIDSGKGFDTVIVSPDKNTKNAVAKLKVGEWSERIIETFKVGKTNKKAAFKMKLIELSRDGKRIRLYMTPICGLDDWAFPASTCRELVDIGGLPIPNTFFQSHAFDWIDTKTLLELIEMQHVWLAEAASKLMAGHECDLYFMHAHCPDHSYHLFINKLDPGVCKDKKVLAEYIATERGFYMSLDRMIGHIVKAAGPEALIIITSDHGAVPTEGAFDPNFKGFFVGEFLEKSGLMVTKKDGKTGNRIIDWKRTKAVPQRSVYIYVNLKGRDPHGIVKPGHEYEEVCDQVINALYDYTDPKTGKKPIAFALKKSDARIIGLYGDYIGDVVYGIRPEVSGEHGRQLPTGEYGIGSMKGLFIAAGPGIKKNVRLERTVWLTDITPTICYVMNLPLPAQAEGAIVYQALVNPNAPLKELETVRKNYERLQKAISTEKHLTHQYG